MNLTVDSTKNHITTSGYGYDNNGNITSLPQSSGNLALNYDVENRLQMSGGVLMFDMENQPLYDVGAGKYSMWDLNGRRLRHESITIGVDPPDGKAIPYYAITDRNIYFGGRMIQSNSKTVLVDRLGSVRANESGETFEYLPYGEEFHLTSQDREKFATYTRSSANGLDYAVNRWYDSVHGNFITPDTHTLSMDLSNPGTMNRYAYASGDPINTTDAQGLEDSYPCGDGFSADSFASCTPDLAEPGLFNAGLGNIPCANGTMISTFATPAEIANCEAPGLGPEGPGGAPYDQPLQAPACFARLKDRPVNDPIASVFNAYHSFWWIQDSTGAQDIISGGPQNGFLDVWVIPGANNGADNSTDMTVWNSGLSSSVCGQVDNLEATADSFPKDKIRYSAWPGPNSNSAAHYLANSGDFYFSVPSNLYGWNVGVPIPGTPGPGKGRIIIRHCAGGRPCAK